MALDMQGLLAQLSGGQDQGMSNRDMMFAAAQGDALTGARAAQMKLAQNIEQQGTRGLTSLMGGDPRSVAEKVQAELAKHDTSTEAGQRAAVAAIRAIPGASAAAEQLRNSFVEQNQARRKLEQVDRQLGQDDRALDNEEAMIPIRRQNAMIQQAQLSMSAARDLLAQQNAGVVAFSEKKSNAYDAIDNKNWDPKAVRDYREAVRTAESEAELNMAFNALQNRSRLESGNVWREEVNPSTGKPEYYIYPKSGEAREELVSNVNQLNTAQRSIKSNALSLVGFIEDAEKLLANPDATVAGFRGRVLSFMKSTKAGELSSKLGTILNNQGFNALMEAKANSPTGASGFGSLSERELEVLQGLMGSLDQGLPPEVLRDNLAQMKGILTKAAEDARDNWTADTFWRAQIFEEQPVDLGAFSTEELEAMIR